MLGGRSDSWLYIGIDRWTIDGSLNGSLYIGIDRRLGVGVDRWLNFGYIAN